MSAKRIGVFGWGVVAPKSPNIEAFRHNLSSSRTWLSPFHGYGPDNFLVGQPEFHFDDYRPWIDARFTPRHFRTLKEKMDFPVQYALGAFIQSLGQNPGIEQELQALGHQAHVYVGTGLGSLGVIHDASVTLYKTQRVWNRFWSQTAHNPAIAAHRNGTKLDEAAPPNPDNFWDIGERELAEEAWNEYWVTKSEPLREYLSELATIEDFNLDRKSTRLNSSHRH